MSFQDAFVWTLLRSLAVAGLAVPMSEWLVRLVQQTAGRTRYWCLLLVLSPLFAPDLIVGYSYRSFELSLLHRPILNHGFYFVLVLLKFLPAAAIVRICLPPAAVSQAALHCARLSERRACDRSLSRGMWVRSRLVRHLPVFGIVFLLSMQEFEIASLMQIPAWTVHLFDAQAGGLNPLVSAQQLIMPVFLQSLVLMPLIWTVVLNSSRSAPRWRIGDLTSVSSLCPGVVIALVAVTLLWAIPIGVVGWSSFSGIQGVLQNEILIRSTLLDLAAAIAIAVSCSVLALVVAWAVRNVVVDDGQIIRHRTSLYRVVIVLLAIVPGLFGILAVSIVTVLAIQQPPLTSLRATVWPMAFAMILFLIPRAFLLALSVPGNRHSESSHLATLLRASPPGERWQSAARLKWWFEARPLVLIAAVLFYWCLANLTAAALLCPPTIPLLSFDGNIVPLPVRLYKFIHQGRTATLSVMALLSVIVPLLLILLASRVAPRLYLHLATTGTQDR